jgi:hypothetical protein
MTSIRVWIKAKYHRKTFLNVVKELDSPQFIDYPKNPTNLEISDIISNQPKLQSSFFHHKPYKLKTTKKCSFYEGITEKSHEPFGWIIFEWKKCHISFHNAVLTYHFRSSTSLIKSLSFYNRIPHQFFSISSVESAFFNLILLEHTYVYMGMSRGQRTSGIHFNFKFFSCCILL